MVLENDRKYPDKLAVDIQMMRLCGQDYVAALRFPFPYHGLSYE